MTDSTQVGPAIDVRRVIDIGKFTSQQHQVEELRIIGDSGDLYRGN